MKGYSILFHLIYGFMTMECVAWPPWRSEINISKKKVVWHPYGLFPMLILIFSTFKKYQSKIPHTCF